VQEAHIRSLAEGQEPGLVQRVELLGHTGELEWRRDGEGLHIRLPAQLPGKHAFTFKIR
jgi:hypothetical protein